MYELVTMKFDVRQFVVQYRKPNVSSSYSSLEAYNALRWWREGLTLSQCRCWQSAVIHSFNVISIKQ